MDDMYDKIKTLSEEISQCNYIRMKRHALQVKWARYIMYKPHTIVSAYTGCKCTCRVQKMSRQLVLHHTCPFR